MSELFWPGDHRAGALFGDRAFLEAMVAVEAAWAGVELEVPEVDLDVEAGGNPVIPLLEALRAAHPDLTLHAGLTSQDVLDTALMLMVRQAVAIVEERLDSAQGAVRRLDASHGRTPMMGRTLTQPAQPITFGHKLATWNAGLVESSAELASLTYPVQVGGPVGLMSDGRAALAARLELADAPSCTG